MSGLSGNKDTRENKTNCFPRDMTLSVYHVLKGKVHSKCRSLYKRHRIITSAINPFMYDKAESNWLNQKMSIVILWKVWFPFMVLKLVVVLQGSPTTDLLESADCLLKDCERYSSNNTNFCITSKGQSLASQYCDTVPLSALSEVTFNRETNRHVQDYHYLLLHDDDDTNQLYLA